MYASKTIHRLTEFLGHLKRSGSYEPDELVELRGNFDRFASYLDRLITHIVKKPKVLKKHVVDQLQRKFTPEALRGLRHVRERLPKIRASLDHLFALPDTLHRANSDMSSVNVDPDLTNMLQGILLEPLATIVLNRTANDEYSGQVDYEIEKQKLRNTFASSALLLLPEDFAEYFNALYQKKRVAGHDLIYFLSNICNLNLDSRSPVFRSVSDIFDRLSEKYCKDGLGKKSFELFLYTMQVLAAFAGLNSKNLKTSLINLLDDSDHRVVYFALRALSRFPLSFSGNSQLSSKLKSILQNRQYPNYIEVAATEVLASTRAFQAEECDWLVDGLFTDTSSGFYFYGILTQLIAKNPQLKDGICDLVWKRLKTLKKQNDSETPLPFIFLAKFSPASSKAIELLREGNDSVMQTFSSDFFVAYLVRFATAYDDTLDTEALRKDFDAHLTKHQSSEPLNYVYCATLANVEHDRVLETIVNNLSDSDFMCEMLSISPALGEEFFRTLVNKYPCCDVNKLELFLYLFDCRITNRTDFLRQQLDYQVSQLNEAKLKNELEIGAPALASNGDNSRDGLVDLYLRFIEDNFTNSIFTDDQDQVKMIIQQSLLLNQAYVKDKVRAFLAAKPITDRTARHELYARINKLYNL